LTYTELKALLITNNLNFKDTAIALGYNPISISNNWSKDKNIPKKAEIAFLNYVKLRKEEKKNLDLQEQLYKLKNEDSQSNCLSIKALKIASQKCEYNGLDLNEYLSSLVIGNI